MEISLRSISAKLGKYNPELIIFDEDKTQLRAVKMVETGQTIFEQDILYVVMDANLPNVTHCANFLCVGSNSKPKLNLIVLHGNFSLTTIINEVLEVFASQQKFAEDSQKLLAALIAGKGVQNIISEGYKLLRNPIFVLDKSMKLIARTENIPDDTIWTDLMQYGYYSYENMRLAKFEKRYEKIINSKQLMLLGTSQKEKFQGMDILNVSTQYLKNARIIANIFNKSQKIGSVTVIQWETEFEQQHFDLIKLMTDVISTEMQKTQYFQSTKGSLHEYLIKDLLDGEIKSREILDERLKSIDWTLKKNLFVFAITTKQNNDLLPFLNYLENMLPGILNDARATVYQGHIIFIISTNKEKAINPSKLETVIKFFEQNDLYGGFSQCFHNLLDMKKYYMQAVKSIVIGIQFFPNKNVFDYAECTLFDLIDLCSNQANLIDFCHPALLRLIEYDQIHKTQYTKSLHIFLNHFNDLAISAKTLNIHRNSLGYRMHKIEEIMDVSLEDSIIVHHLFISFLILRYLHYDDLQQLIL